MASFADFRDNFNDNSLDAGLWSSVGSVTEANQQIELEAVSGSFFSILTSANGYDLTDSQATIKIVEIDSYVESQSLRISIDIQNLVDRGFGFSINNGFISAGYTNASLQYISVYKQPFNINNYRYLRVRHQSSDDRIYFEYSSDRSTWNDAGSFTRPYAITSFYARVSVLAGSDIPSFTLKVDDFNVEQEDGTAIGVTNVITSATGDMTYNGTINGTTNVVSSAFGYISIDIIEIEKTYLVKVYDGNGDFVGIWKDRTTQNFSFYRQVNSLGSAVTFRLGRSARNLIETRANITDESSNPIETADNRNIEATTTTFSTVGENTDVELNYIVDVYVYEGRLEAIETAGGEIITDDAGDPIEAILGSPDGRKIFSGWISKYAAYYGDDEYVDVTVLNHSTELDNYIVNDGAGDTTVTYNSTDPGQMLRNILDQYSTDGGTLTYSNDTVELTGNTSSYTFRLVTVKEAIDKILELSPDDWYWYIDQGTSEVHFHQVGTTADHTFTFKKEIQEVKIERHIEDMVNNVYFAGGGDPQLLKQYDDTTSQTNWRLGTEILNDSRVTTAASAQTLSEALIDRYKDPVYSSQVRILDKKYRTEDIELGETVGFGNFGNFVDTVVLMIVGINYDKYGVTLELGTLLPEVNKRLEEVKRNLRIAETNNVPDAPT